MTTLLAPASPWIRAPRQPGRLTEEERRFRAMTGMDLQRLLVGANGLAPKLGWDHLHIRPLRTAGGIWKTPTSGTLARWPDLTLVRVRDRRLIFAELKRELEDPTPEQIAVLDALAALEQPLAALASGYLVTRVEVHVWRPSDLADPIQDSVIGRILR